PMDNFDNVLIFLKLINCPESLNIGMRHISLSTCGLVENIDKLAEYNLQLTLSVSLHAPDNETRSRIMPVNRKHDVDELLSACRRYFEKTGRRVSYEYSMIHKVNDTPFHARLLSEKLAGTGSHVNLIRLNHVDERSLEPSTQEDLNEFMRILKSRNINVTLRRRLASDIDPSCGHLRRKTQSL
ncbi:MAG: radical SAM protein, partial [Oscillospiraceae bacterium]|nr:radical SAM protein [Oscillospiraceae bacterium]